MQRVRRERGFGVNPWTHAHPLPRLAPPADRRGLRRPAARLARRLPRRLAADPRRGAPRGPVERPEVRHRLADHAGRPRPGPALRAPAVPVGHAAQRPLQQLLRAAGDPRPAALLPRRAGRSKKLLDDVMVRRLKEDIREIAGRLPASATSCRSTSTACRPTPRSCGCPRCSTSTASCARSGCSGETKRKQAAAGLLDHRPAAAAAVVDRGVRPHAARPPPDGRSGSGKQTQAARRSADAPGLLDLLGGAVGSDDDRADACPKRSCRRRKTPRSRPRRCAGRCRQGRREALFAASSSCSTR